jgi:hypothetical protein
MDEALTHAKKDKKKGAVLAFPSFQLVTKTLDLNLTL